MIHLPRVFLNSLLAVLFLLLYGCLQVPAPAAMDTPAPTATATIPPLTLSGPETTPISPRAYPSSLTVETAEQGISAVVDAPSTITGLAEVQLILTKHTQLARDKGLSFDHMAVKYVSGEQRWFLVPVASDGMITGWLEIADPSSQSGWRFGEQPTWDSQYHPSTDTYQYGLPALHDPANHFEIGFTNGFPILIEVTSSGTPQYWNNIAQKTTLLVEGAVLPTPEFPPLPEEFLSQIPADKQYKITNGQVLVDGQAWFEINSAGEWRKSDWKLLADAPNQIFWEEKYIIEKSLRQHFWPVLTGENLEVTQKINGQPVLIKGRLGVIPNPYQSGILKVLIPYRFEWGDGLVGNVWVITETEEKNTDYFLQLPSGEQVLITGAIDSSHRPAECTFGTRCGWNYDIADLSANFFLNSVTPDEPVIVSPVTIKVK